MDVLQPRGKHRVDGLAAAGVRRGDDDVQAWQVARQVRGGFEEDAAEPVDFAQAHLKPEGALVCKVFHGSGYSQLVKLFKEQFRIVKPLKPKASRDKSSETFLVGIGLKEAG